MQTKQCDTYLTFVTHLAMNKNKRTANIIAMPAIVASTLFLVACGGEPSSSDVKSLVETELKPVLEMQTKMLSGLTGVSPANAPTLKEVKKTGCKEDGENAYRCDVEIVMTDGKSRNVPMRFVKGSNGWSLSQ